MILMYKKYILKTKRIQKSLIFGKKVKNIYKK